VTEPNFQLDRASLLARWHVVRFVLAKSDPDPVASRSATEQVSYEVEFAGDDGLDVLMAVVLLAGSTITRSTGEALRQGLEDEALMLADLLYPLGDNQDGLTAFYEEFGVDGEEAAVEAREADRPRP
jgi:hypothetical protein